MEADVGVEAVEDKQNSLADLALQVIHFLHLVSTLMSQRWSFICIVTIYFMFFYISGVFSLCVLFLESRFTEVKPSWKNLLLKQKNAMTGATGVAAVASETHYCFSIKTIQDEPIYRAVFILCKIFFRSSQFCVRFF